MTQYSLKHTFVFKLAYMPVLNYSQRMDSWMRFWLIFFSPLAYVLLLLAFLSHIYILYCFFLKKGLQLEYSTTISKYTFAGMNKRISSYL